MVVVVVGPSASGCIGDQDISGLRVYNDTTQTLWVDEEPDNDQSRRIEIDPGGQTIVSTDECISAPLEAQDRDGTTVAVLSEEWCPGQRWRVRGEGESALEDSE